MILMFSALLFALAALLLIVTIAQRRVGQRQVEQRLQGNMERVSAVNGWLRLLGESRVSQRAFNLDSEAQLLLNRMGWRRAGQRSLYAASQIGVPILALGLTLVVQSSIGVVNNTWVAPMFALALGYLVPKRLLVSAARRRQKRVAREISTFIPLLRVLFESGMAVEQSLRVLSEQGSALLPILTSELRMILVRVDSGLELAEELRKASTLLDVEEFTDTCVILQQLLHQGGGAMRSLLALKELLDDRRLTALQEYISKMSAKMSIVMMSLLFPALLIVLAGPGFIAVGRAMAKGLG